MHSLRVLLTDIPSNVLADLLDGITSSTLDMEIIDKPLTREELSRDHHRYNPDIVIIGVTRDEVPPFYHSLLEKMPHSVIAGLFCDGRNALISIGNIGGQQLVSTLRAAKRADAPPGDAA